jgi:hypothetical protein
VPTSIWRPIPDAASGPVGDGFGCSVGHGFGCPIRLSFRCPVRLSFRCPIRDGFGCSVRHSFRCAVRHDRVHQARFPTDRLAAHPGLGGDSEHILIVSNAPEHPVLRVSGGGDDAVPAGPGGAYSDGVVSHGVINGEDRVRVTGCVRFRIRRRVGSPRRSEMIGEVGSDGQRPGKWLRAGLVSRRSRVGRPTRLAPPRPRSAFASPYSQLPIDRCAVLVDPNSCTRAHRFIRTSSTRPGSPSKRLLTCRRPGATSVTTSGPIRRPVVPN